MLVDSACCNPRSQEFLEAERRMGRGTVRRRGVPRPDDKENATHVVHDDDNHHHRGNSLPDTSVLFDTNCCLMPPIRTDADFADRLWYLLRRGRTAADLHHAVQAVLDCLGDAFVEPQQAMTDKAPRRNGLLPPLRKGSCSKLAALIRMVIRASQLRRYRQTSIREGGATTAHDASVLPHAREEAKELQNLEAEWVAARDSCV